MKYAKNIIECALSGVLKIELDPHTDERGEIWSIYEDCDFLPTFVEDKVTISKKGVLRGLHGDTHTDKLICCMSGEIFLAVVDARTDSKTFGQTETFHLTAEHPTIVLVPAGCLNGHLCLSERCLFFYKWSQKYNGPESQVTVRWDDPELGIPWPITTPILSPRDQGARSLADVFGDYDDDDPYNWGN